MPPSAITAAAAQTAIDTLESYIAHTNTRLVTLANRLKHNFDQDYPAGQPNPLTIITRLRTLQNNLPQIRERLIQIHQHKLQLAAQCRKELAESAKLAAQLLPVAQPDEAAASRAEMEERQGEMNEVLATFFKPQPGLDTALHPSITVANDAVGDLNMALLRAAADAPYRSDAVLTERDTNSDETEEQPAKPATKSQRPKPGATKKATASKPNSKPTKSKSPANKSSSTAFEPVTKAVYNRLPRILKVKAGKLPQINEFYEKVYNAMAEKGGVMTNVQLKKATGEQDEQRFEVLRGLTVLRKHQNGWQLTCMKT